MKKSANIASKLAPYIAFILLLVVWEISVRIYKTPEYILPGPIKIINTLEASYSLLSVHTATTVMEALLGFSLSIIFAFVVGFLLTSIKWLNQALYPMFHIFWELFAKFFG
jgi:ABC-type nitrate/sulfonate/bicarbonate transport system permease component